MNEDIDLSIQRRSVPWLDLLRATLRLFFIIPLILTSVFARRSHRKSDIPFKDDIARSLGRRCIARSHVNSRTSKAHKFGQHVNCTLLRDPSTFDVSRCSTSYRFTAVPNMPGKYLHRDFRARLSRVLALQSPITIDE